MRTTKSILIVLFALSAAQIASAYYCPSTGRWLSRDPMGEPGFETLRAAGIVPKAGQVISPASLPPSRWINRDQITTSKNSALSYAFVGNDSEDRIDPLGLLSYSEATQPAPPGECSLVIGCYEVLHSGDYHCFSLFIDDQGNINACRGGNSRKKFGSGSSGSTGNVPSKCGGCCGFWGTVVRDCGPFNKSFPDYDDRNRATYTVEEAGPQVCSARSCVEKEMANIQDQCYKYRPIAGPNSNTALYTALSSCGLGTTTPPLPSPSDVPAWGNFPPNAKQCLK